MPAAQKRGGKPAPLPGLGCLGRTRYSWSIRRAATDRHRSPRNTGRGSCNSSSTAPGQKTKNWALEHLPFRNEWVFILDADEVLPAGAEAEFQTAIAPAGEKAGDWINRRFMFMGRWLRHACYPNWNLRLFRHSLGRYEKLTEVVTASGDNEVHEHVMVQGPTGRLRCQIDHYAFPSVEVFVEKHNRYSNWEARVAVAEKRALASSGLQSMRVAQRRRLKRLSRRLPFHPLLRFLYVYVWQRGFLDGREGYYFARLHAFYEFLSVAKTCELKRQSKR